MAKSKLDLKKEEERLEKLMKEALKREDEWMWVEECGKVILINEDELKIEPIKKTKMKN